MIWARWAGVMGVPMKWEIARIFVVGTGGSGFCAEAAPSGVIGFFMAVAPYLKRIRHPVLGCNVTDDQCSRILAGWAPTHAAGLPLSLPSRDKTRPTSSPRDRDR